MNHSMQRIMVILLGVGLHGKIYITDFVLLLYHDCLLFIVVCY